MEAMTLEMVRDQVAECANGTRLAPMRSELEAWSAVITAHLAQAGSVGDDDVRWLLAQLRHNEFSHDYIKDEKACDMCKRIKRIAALLPASPTPGKEGK